jgi:hypothetical protein
MMSQCQSKKEPVAVAVTLKDSSLLPSVQIAYGTHAASYSVVTRNSFLGVKRLLYEADRWSPSNAKVKNG